MTVTKKLFVPIIKTCAQFILYLRKRNVVTNSPRTGLVCLVPLLPKYTQIFFLQLLLNYGVFRLFVGSRMRWTLQLWATSTLDTLHGLQMPWRRSFTLRILTTGFVSPILRDIKWSNEINQRQRQWFDEFQRSSSALVPLLKETFYNEKILANIRPSSEGPMTNCFNNNLYIYTSSALFP